MRGKRGMRRRRTAALFLVGIAASGCTNADDQALDDTATSIPSSTQTSIDETLTPAFTDWYNRVTSGDAALPTCAETAPVWVVEGSLSSTSSGPLLICADRNAEDELVLRIVNNASGPMSIDYPDATAGWELDSAEPEGVMVLAGGTGVLVRPGVAATLTAGPGPWDAQELSISFPERWAIVEAASQLMKALDLEETFVWAGDLSDPCDVETVAAADLGAPLEAGLHDYFDCVLDNLGDAAADDQRQALSEIVPLVAELVERSRNVASQQRAGVVATSLVVASQLPEPAGPSIETTTTTTTPPVTRVTTTNPPTTSPPTTVASSAVPSTVASTTTTAPRRVTTTQENPDLTVPLPPAPVLVALETVAAGVDTYTSWPAIDPKLSRLAGGQIVVIECRAFSATATPGGNGWWYRIGSGESAGGWASATGFVNLVAGVAPGSTAADNVSDAVSDC